MTHYFIFDNMAHRLIREDRSFEHNCKKRYFEKTIIRNLLAAFA